MSWTILQVSVCLHAQGFILEPVGPSVRIDALHYLRRMEVSSVPPAGSARDRKAPCIDSVSRMQTWHLLLQAFVQVRRFCLFHLTMDPAYAYIQACRRGLWPKCASVRHHVPHTTEFSFRGPGMSDIKHMICCEIG